MADQTVKRPICILHDALMKVESFMFPTNFVILDCEVDFEFPIIIGRSFLETGLALVDMDKGQMKSIYVGTSSRMVRSKRYLLYPTELIVYLRCKLKNNLMSRH